MIKGEGVTHDLHWKIAQKFEVIAQWKKLALDLMIAKNYARKYKMKNNSTAHSFQAMVWVLEINEISKKLGHHSTHKIKIQNNLRSITKKTIMCSRSAITKDCDMKK